MPVAVIAKLSVKLDQLSEFESAFALYQQKVRTLEAGILFFHLHKSREIAGSYTVLEQYTNDSALNIHRNSDHYKAIPATFGAFMAGSPDIQVLDSVG